MARKRPFCGKKAVLTPDFAENGSAGIRAAGRYVKIAPKSRNSILGLKTRLCLYSLKGT